MIYILYGLWVAFFSSFYSFPLTPIHPTPLYPYTIDRRPSSYKRNCWPFREQFAVHIVLVYVCVYTRAHSILKCPLCFTCSPTRFVYVHCLF